MHCSSLPNFVKKKKEKKLGKMFLHNNMYLLFLPTFDEVNDDSCKSSKNNKQLC